MADYQQFGQQPARGFAPFGTMPAFGNDGTVQGGGYVAPSTTPAAPADAATGPTPFQGSSLDTLYGVDSESFLSDDQRKLARQIQGKFDASMNRRDRELQRYASPRLSSFVEDEALARAMALARGLNAGSPDVLGQRAGGGAGGGGAGPRGVGGSGGGGSGGGGSLRPGGSSGMPTLRYPTSGGGAAKPPAGANWQQIMSGLASIAPLLFGKDAWGEFMNKGLINTVKESIFGPNNGMSDAQFEQMTRVYGPNSGWGQDVMQQPPPADAPSIYDSNSGWGQDVIQPPDPDPYGIGGYDGGWDPGAAVDNSGGWWGDAGDFYYPDAGSAWDTFDPYAIGGW